MTTIDAAVSLVEGEGVNEGNHLILPVGGANCIIRHQIESKVDEEIKKNHTSERV